MDSDEENTINSDENSDNDVEIDQDEDPTRCLFCEIEFKTIDEAFLHLVKAHSFSFEKLKCKFQMDQYSYIKLINFIRANQVEPNSIMETNEILWNDEKYLKPIEYETWLTFDFESEPTYKNKLNPSEESSESQSKDEIIKQLTKEIEMKNSLLKQASDDMEKIRTGFKSFLKNANNADTNESKDVIGDKLESVSEESYFSSYAHFNIHYEMLSDSVRTESYRDAFLKNKSFVNGKTVLDIGCGTGILSMFASLAGAKTVVGIDNSEVVYNAMEIITKNKFENIKLVKSKIESASLPIDKFDIIVSEWMGYFLIFEGMLDSIIYGRNKYLKPGGTLMPNRCTLSIVGYGNQKRYNDYIEFWDSVYGLDMTTLKKEVIHEPSFEICDSEHVLTEENVLVDYDLNTVSLGYSDFEFDFNLKCKKSGFLTSFMGYFDTFFGLPEPVHFSTSAFAKSTHWKQCVFYLDRKIEVKEGDVVKGTLICKRSSTNSRSLNIKIIAFDKEYAYEIN